jgi:hypothetical protein
MPLRPFLPLAVLTLAACSSPDEVREKTGVTAEATQAATHASATASATGQAKKVSEETDLIDYDFSYPAAVGAIPALARQLEQEAAKARAETLAEAKAGQADAKADGFPFHPYGLSHEWKVVADLPGYLSLSDEVWTYTGGAHGNYGVAGYVWDKAAGRGFDSGELFQSPAALGSAMGDSICKALDAERTKRRGEPVDHSDDFMGGCPTLGDATILVGSANGKTFDRITVYFGPYVAGPYAEGAYELDFPMTKAMLGAVKPAYKPVFSAKQ